MAKVTPLRQAIARLAGGGARAALLRGLVYACLAGLILMLLRWPPPGAVRIETATARPADTIGVLVGGSVTSPGVYTLLQGATVADALTAAGGALPQAAAAIDASRVLADGDQVIVGMDGGAPATPAPRLDINSATAADLQALPGIGPTLAERIVAYRCDHGAFSTVEELLNVTGIGDKTLADLRPLIEVR